MVDRARLSAAVIGNPKALRKLESIIHPMVRSEENAFRDSAQSQGAKLAVIDIPLLFETGGDKRVDKILVVSAPAEVQKRRVLARADMTPEKLEAILERQTPDAEKRARADFVVNTDQTFDATRAEINEIIRILTDS